MSYYKATEKYLYNYNFLKVYKDNMKKEIDNMDYNPIKSMDLEYKGSSGYKGSTVESKVISIDEKKRELKKDIENLETKLTRIDKAIEILNDKERHIITKRYFESKQWWEIGTELKYNERHCRRIRNEAIDKISVALFGEDAMNNAN